MNITQIQLYIIQWVKTYIFTIKLGLELWLQNILQNLQNDYTILNSIHNILLEFYEFKLILIELDFYSYFIDFLKLLPFQKFEMEEVLKNNNNLLLINNKYEWFFLIFENFLYCLTTLKIITKLTKIITKFNILSIFIKDIKNIFKCNKEKISKVKIFGKVNFTLLIFSLLHLKFIYIYIENIIFMLILYFKQLINLLKWIILLIENEIIYFILPLTFFFKNFFKKPVESTTLLSTYNNSFQFYFAKWNPIPHFLRFNYDIWNFLKPYYEQYFFLFEKAEELIQEFWIKYWKELPNFILFLTKIWKKLYKDNLFTFNFFCNILILFLNVYFYIFIKNFIFYKIFYKNIKIYNIFAKFYIFTLFIVILFFSNNLIYNIINIIKLLFNNLFFFKYFIFILDFIIYYYYIIVLFLKNLFLFKINFLNYFFFNIFFILKLLKMELLYFIWKEFFFSLILNFNYENLKLKKNLNLINIEWFVHTYINPIYNKFSLILDFIVMLLWNVSYSIDSYDWEISDFVFDNLFKYKLLLIEHFFFFKKTFKILILLFISKFSKSLSWDLASGIYLEYLKYIYIKNSKYILSFLPIIDISKYWKKIYTYIEKIFKWIQKIIWKFFL